MSNPIDYKSMPFKELTVHLNAMFDRLEALYQENPILGQIIQIRMALTAMPIPVEYVTNIEELALVCDKLQRREYMLTTSRESALVVLSPDRIYKVPYYTAYYVAEKRGGIEALKDEVVRVNEIAVDFPQGGNGVYGVASGAWQSPAILGRPVGTPPDMFKQQPELSQAPHRRPFLDFSVKPPQPQPLHSWLQSPPARGQCYKPLKAQLDPSDSIDNAPAQSPTDISDEPGDEDSVKLTELVTVEVKGVDELVMVEVKGIDSEGWKYLTYCDDDQEALKLLNEWKQLSPTELMRQVVLRNAEQSKMFRAISLAG